MAKSDELDLSENTGRKSGRDAQRMNIYAAKLISETVRTTLGPKGMDKMLVDSDGFVTVTNDGVTILKQIEVDHPAAKMIIEIAKTQETEVGDGTTSAVILAGELLKQAENLLDEGIHPSIISKGYRLANDKALEIIPKFKIKIDDNEEVSKQIAMTAMTGKGPQEDKEYLAELLLVAVRKVSENGVFVKERVGIEKKVGGSVKDTELIEGVVIDKERVHSQMPEKVALAKIALINTAIELKVLEQDSKISINDPKMLESFIEMEERMIKKAVQRIVDSGANVVFCQKGIDDYAQHLLAKNGIYACRRIRKDDMEKLSKATNARIVSEISELTPKDLGGAGVVYEELVGEDYMTYVEKCKNPRTVTLLVRGSTTHIVDEVKRALEDAIGDLQVFKGEAVIGAGNFEMRLSMQLEKEVSKLSGREQLAAVRFAKSLEVIPKTLIENAGLDTIDKMAQLKSQIEKRNLNCAINVYNGELMDAKLEGIIEPLKVKERAINSAAEVAIMILRIDDVILSKQEKER